MRDALHGRLPEPLSDVLEREAEQRTRVAAVLDVLDEGLRYEHGRDS